MPSFFIVDPIESRNFLLASTISFFTVLTATPIVKRTTLRYGRVDSPSSRKLHKYPVARTGGIAICVATVVALSIIWCLGGMVHFPSEIVRSFWIAVLGSFSFFCIGLVDDFIDLPAGQRLLVQCIVSAVMWIAGVRIDTLFIPAIGITELHWLSLPMTVIWITGIVNAINWNDGLDGLAAGTSSIAAATCSVICIANGQMATALICLSLLGSLLGFLAFNFNPAQIFMGDGGSYFVGSLLANISIVGLSDTSSITPVVLPLLVLAVPIADMLFVILARLFQGVSPFCADNRHLHHRLMQAGLTHRATVILIWAIAYWTASIALVLTAAPGGLLVSASATVTLLVMIHKARSLWIQSPLLG